MGSDSFSRYFQILELTRYAPKTLRGRFVNMDQIYTNANSSTATGRQRSARAHASASNAGPPPLATQNGHWRTRAERRGRRRRAWRWRGCLISPSSAARMLPKRRRQLRMYARRIPTMTEYVRRALFLPIAAPLCETSYFGETPPQIQT